GAPRRPVRSRPRPAEHGAQPECGGRPGASQRRRWRWRPATMTGCALVHATAWVRRGARPKAFAPRWTMPHCVRERQVDRPSGVAHAAHDLHRAEETEPRDTVKPRLHGEETRPAGDRRAA